MGAKFHIAMFCSDTAYEAKKLFYTKVFGAEPLYEGDINDGAEGYDYRGCFWDCETRIALTTVKDSALTASEVKLAHNCENGTRFGLLKNLALKDLGEKLAHIGLIFDTSLEFDTAIQKYNIDKQAINIHSHGIRQVFKKDAKGIEWEFTYVPSGVNG